MEFVVATYRITSKFPRDELYGLTNQLRRAAVSIPSNIAEGQGRHSTREFLNFLSIAIGSRNEAETQILLAKELEYINEQQCSDLLSLSADVGRLKNGLRNSLTNKAND